MTATRFVVGWEPRVYSRDELVAKLARERGQRQAVRDAYLGWAPASDTREMPAFRRGVPLTEQPTAELHLLDLRPAVAPARRPRRRLVSRADIAAAWDSALTVAGGIAAGLTFLALITLTRPLGELLLTAAHGGH